MRQELFMLKGLAGSACPSTLQVQAVTLWAGVQAVLAYRVPLAGSLDRPQRKILHAALHSAALLCIVLALVAAFQSHNLKRPTPTPNLYSPHSYLGLAVTILAFLQARPAPVCPALPLVRGHNCYSSCFTWTT